MGIKNGEQTDIEKKCVIFGASVSGEEAYNVLKGCCDIICFSDNDSKKWGERLCDMDIISPNDIKSDWEVIIASHHYAAIGIQLAEAGIRNIKVFVPNIHKLYDYDSNRVLFDKCIYDSEKVEIMKTDFMVNYTCIENADKNSGNKSIKIEDVKQHDKNYSNREKKKKVLFCAYLFPPLGSSGVQRSVKFAKYLGEFGYEPIVLTVGNNRFGLKTDYEMLKEIKGIQVIRIDDSFILPELLSEREQQEIINLYEGIVQSEEWLNEYKRIVENPKERWKLIPDEKICWVNECLKVIEKKIDLSSIDIVYTTGAPFSVYILGYYIKMKYNIKWVQDYRDPWANNQHYIENFYRHMSSTIDLQRHLERGLTQMADAIIVMADGMRKQFEDMYELSNVKIHTITNGYDSEDFKDISVKEESCEKFTLCHNGAVYIDRNPIGLINTINNMIENKEVDKEKIQLKFNGEIEEKWHRAIDAADIYHIVKYNGYMEHLKSIKSAMSSNMLILFGTVGEGALILYTGKIFEYLNMRRPIIAFSSKDGVIDKLLEHTKTGKNFEYDDYVGIKNYIKEVYESWKIGVETIVPDMAEVEKYSRRSLTKKLADVFDGLLCS